MSQAFKTVNYVFDKDITTMSKADLIDAIKRVNKDIADLEAVGVESTHITKEIARLSDARANILAALDA